MDCGWNSGDEEADFFFYVNITLNFIFHRRASCMKRKKELPAFLFHQIKIFEDRANRLLLSALTTLKKEYF